MLEFLLFLKEVVLNKELAGMFLFVFVIMAFWYKDDVRTVAKMLRTILIFYTVTIIALKMIIA